MVKIFIGNLSQNTEKEEIEALFTKYGTVTECAKHKNYAFVHMENRKSATKAIRELHLHKLDGRPMNVEPSRRKNQGPLKLHVANVERGFDKELRELFEEYGTVTECSIVKNFAFVHMPNYDEAMDALQDIDNTEFQGKRIHVQVSKSRPRGPLEEEDSLLPPGRENYYPPFYPGVRAVPLYRGQSSVYSPPSPPPLPPQRRDPYPNHGYGKRDSDAAVDFYEKYRARPYGVPDYDDRNAIPPPPPPTSALVRERLGMGPLDRYERRPLPTTSSYGVRDRSPIRRPPPPPAPTTSNGYLFERSRLSPMSRAPIYTAPRPRGYFSARIPPPPPPPRHTGY